MATLATWRLRAATAQAHEVLLAWDQMAVARAASSLRPFVRVIISWYDIIYHDKAHMIWN